MTREEAIERVKMILEEATADEDAVSYVTSDDANALDMAIKALEQEPCGKDINVSTTDAISREAVDTLVDELARAISDERCGIPRGRSTATIMQDILDLPPVNPQPKTGHWIPISERLPENNKLILIYAKSKSRSSDIFTVGMYSKDVWFFQSTTAGHYAYPILDYEAVAWMPLPEPYKAEKEE